MVCVACGAGSVEVSASEYATRCATIEEYETQLAIYGGSYALSVAQWLDKEDKAAVLEEVAKQEARRDVARNAYLEFARLKVASPTLSDFRDAYAEYLVFDVEEVSVFDQETFERDLHRYKTGEYLPLPDDVTENVMRTSFGLAKRLREARIVWAELPQEDRSMLVAAGCEFEDEFYDIEDVGEDRLN